MNLTLMMLVAIWLLGVTTGFPSTLLAITRPCKPSPREALVLPAAMSQADKERLLLTEPAQNAFIVAEMRHFLSSALERNDKLEFTRWAMTDKERIAAKLVDENGNILSDEYAQLRHNMTGELAVDLLCNATQSAFRDGFSNQPGLLSALGSAICFFRDSFRSPANLAACERVGLSDYDVAHHITDMYHHLNFRGAYTKTLAPSGKGDAAARIAVGLELEEDSISANDNEFAGEKALIQDDDECLLWSPTTPDVCIHWKSDDEAWRKKRFEKIQMEGARDPRRGGSGTTR